MRRAESLLPILIGFVPIWLVMDRSATLLGSTRGEWGLLVAALVLAAAVVVERLLFRRPPLPALCDLGLGRPGARGVAVGLALALVLISFYPVFSAVTGTPVRLRGDWLGLLPGLFAQAGIAEETTFRGYLFRHLRSGRSFGKAALLAMIPFTAVHLLLFAHMDASVAAASTLLAVAISFPLAHLFELGRHTIWLPALIHFVIQGSIKVVEIPGTPMMVAAVVWMVVCAVVPYLVFLVRRPRASVAVAGVLAVLLVAGPGARRGEAFVPGPGSPHGVAANPSTVAAADFDGDGARDILTACSRTDSVSLLLGDGRGSFRPSRSFRALRMPHLVAVGDFNGDRKPDAVVSAHDANEVAVLLNDGQGNLSRWSTVVVFRGGRPHNHGLAIGDLNGDGRLDLTVGHQDLGKIAVLLGDGRGGFRHAGGSPVAVGRAPYPHALADVNGDRRLDLVVPDVSGNRVRLFAGDGRGGFRPLRAIATGLGRPYFVLARDVNGDRRIDLIVTHDDTQRVAALLGDGRGGFRRVRDSPFDGRAASWKGDAADLNGDGRVDLALAGGGSVRIFDGDGRGGFRFRTALPTRGESWDVALADLNGDGRSDALTPSGAGNVIHVFLAP